MFHIIPKAPLYFQNSHNNPYKKNPQFCVSFEFITKYVYISFFSHMMDDRPLVFMKEKEEAGEGWRGAL